LHHFYRAMAWLGETVEQASGSSPAPRCIKDVIEERLFERRRDRFTDLSVVFMDTTSLSFEGDGGESLGQHGYSKDLRPDLQQFEFTTAFRRRSRLRGISCCNALAKRVCLPGLQWGQSLAAGSQGLDL
jgi:hypothetical protein